MLKIAAVLCSVVFISGFVESELTYSGNGETQAHWNLQAKLELNKARKLKPNIHVAKSVILFLGDGMGVSTVTAARILKGQLQRKSGEEGLLSFEEFPNVGLSKTYNQDQQTADSAGTATAFLSGVKTNAGVLGLDARSRRGNCSTVTEETKVKNILHWSQEAGKSVGIVTNTRITHATPGAAYAFTPERDWAGDVDMTEVAGNCSDISKQLVDDNPDINVIMGGGRRTFLTKDDLDPETNAVDSNGRLDGRNLITDWQQKQQGLGRKFSYVWNQTEFDNVDPDNTDYLLGLFSPSHMNYEIERNQDIGGEPSLVEMTEKAIQILQKNGKGFFLLVEGGRIDHGHHDTLAVKALHETLTFADAIQKAVDLTDESDTLIITTADHSHVFTMGGYPSRGNPIFGLVDDPEHGQPLQMADDDKPYSTLGYTNGPGSFVGVNATVRPNITNTNTTDMNYEFQAAVPLYSETHGGEDVGIYARGPMSHLFHGVHEQNYIAHVMAYASCVGPYHSPDQCAQADVSEQALSHGVRTYSVSLLNMFIVAVFLSMII